MRILAVPLFAILIGSASAQEDVEAKKKRLGRLLSQTAQLRTETEKLTDELTGGDPSKKVDILLEAARNSGPELTREIMTELKAQLIANELHASVTMNNLATAEADFRVNDRDCNLVHDFWVADISGLYRIDSAEVPIQGQRSEIRLIGPSVARADARPCVPLEQAGSLASTAKRVTRLVALGKAVPNAGYWFAMIERFQNEKGAEVKYNDGNGRCAEAFGICAYPEKYGKTGMRTFIVNEENTVWMKDTGGKPPDVFPADPAKAGWMRLLF